MLSSAGRHSYAVAGVDVGRSPMRRHVCRNRKFGRCCAWASPPWFARCWNLLV